MIVVLKQNPNRDQLESLSLIHISEPTRLS